MLKAKFVKDELHIDMGDFARELSPELLREFAKLAVFQETLLEAIVDTVAQGVCFEEDWYSGNLDQRLREKLLPVLPQAIQEFCRKLLNDRDNAKAREGKLQSVLSDLARHWPADVKEPDELRRYCHGDYRYWNRDDVLAFIKSQLPEGEWEKFADTQEQVEEPVVL